jgi:hypothetical protein
MKAPFHFNAGFTAIYLMRHSCQVQTSSGYVTTHSPLISAACCPPAPDSTDSRDSTDSTDSPVFLTLELSLDDARDGPALSVSKAYVLLAAYCLLLASLYSRSSVHGRRTIIRVPLPSSLSTLSVPPRAWTMWRH